MSSVLKELRQRFATATPEGADPSAFALAVRESGSPKFGDYQANGCMAIAKTRGCPPREVAAEVASKVDLEPLADAPEIAGAGFLNVKLRDSWISQHLLQWARDPQDALGVEAPESPKTVVIDFSSPNVAKPMHVGHLRSTVIGDSLARIHQALGHKVIKDNHLGDWGLQFGMIIWGWKNHCDQANYREDPVTELSRLYRLASAQIKPHESDGEKIAKVVALQNNGQDDEAKALYAKLLPTSSYINMNAHINAVEQGRQTAEESRRETAKLHAGDPENRALWRRFMPHCLEALNDIYQRLDIHFDHQFGESYYDPMLADVVEDLKAKGLCVLSQGAMVVPMEEGKPPFMIQKSDGAYNYGTTDLATIKHRVENFQPDLILYVVDHRQSDHFKPLFETARRWGYDQVQLEHIAFGTIMAKDKRPYKTRDGDTVGLESLLDEAVAQARKVIDDNSPDLPENERAKVSEIVGLGAIKYADLSQNRLSDYVFDWDKMLAMHGNTATYLQYAYARCRNILRKSEVDVASLPNQVHELILNNSHERSVAVQLLKFPDVLEMSIVDFKPNVLTDYLFDLANRQASFYEACPVIKAESEERKLSRLLLCDLTARVLKKGLSLLGIQFAERM